MNSVVQSLYHLPAFRQLVEALPVDATASVPHSLQRVFRDLRTNREVVCAAHLTRAFKLDPKEHRDAQEFSSMLLDAVSERVGSAKINGLFEGMYRSDVEYSNTGNANPGNASSGKEEPFLHLALDVRGCKHLVHSFEQLVKEEVVSMGKRRIRFLSFPPILVLQLKRVEFDQGRGYSTKVNDPLEFPVELDLTRFITDGDAPTSSSDDPYKYDLHSVIVHKGVAGRGHYYRSVPCNSPPLPHHRTDPP
jgi:ubiquitin carboxyl-terminal hydrolase 7